jgi:hypothetical protein
MTLERIRELCRRGQEIRRDRELRQAINDMLDVMAFFKAFEPRGNKYEV